MGGNIINGLSGSLGSPNQEAHTSVKLNASTNIGPQNTKACCHGVYFVYCIFHLALDMVGQQAFGAWPPASVLRHV